MHDRENSKSIPHKMIYIGYISLIIWFTSYIMAGKIASGNVYNISQYSQIQERETYKLFCQVPFLFKKK